MTHTILQLFRSPHKLEGFSARRTWIWNVAEEQTPSVAPQFNAKSQRGVRRKEF